MDADEEEDDGESILEDDDHEADEVEEAGKPGLQT